MKPKPFWASRCTGVILVDLTLDHDRFGVFNEVKGK